MPVLAGVAEVEITPQLGIELMGYGARTGTATGVHDPLLARALYLEVEDSGEAGRALLIVVAELCLMTPEQARDIRAAIAARTGLEPEQILLSCTHTHSGPDIGLGELLAGQPEPPHVAPIFAGISEAAVRAFADRRPAALGFGRTDVRIGRNRRLADGPVDPELWMLNVQGTDGRPLAVLYHYACHCTVLGHDNLEISGDWAGVTSRRVAVETGAPALFLLGAHADIDPRTRGLMDLAIPGQSLGLGFDAVRVLGEEVAEAILACISEPEARPDPSDTFIAARSRNIRLPLHLGDRAEDEIRAELEERKRELAGLLGLGTDSLPRLSRLDAAALERSRELGPAAARALISRARLFLRDKTAPFFVGGQRELEVEVQAARVGQAALLALPLEPTTNVGLDWKARMRTEFACPGVCGIANGWLRYLPHARDLAHPDAEQHYEVLQSLLAPGAAERLLATGQELFSELG
jgi:hypothetical protein